MGHKTVTYIKQYNSKLWTKQCFADVKVLQLLGDLRIIVDLLRKPPTETYQIQHWVKYIYTHQQSLQFLTIINYHSSNSTRSENSLVCLVLALFIWLHRASIHSLGQTKAPFLHIKPGWSNKLRLHFHIWASIMQLGQTHPGFANTTVERWLVALTSDATKQISTADETMQPYLYRLLLCWLD